MTLNEFKTEFRFSDNHYQDVLGMTSKQLAILPSFALTKNPKLFMLSASVAFNGKYEKIIFIHDLLTSEISLAIDLVYEKLEERLSEIKTELEVDRAKNNSMQLFVEAHVGFTIKQQVSEANDCKAI